MLEINWHDIQRKLEGRCSTCGGELPNHIGICPVYGEELKKKYDNIDANLKHIDESVKKILSIHKEK